jgi:uncharacterized surface protein with fasciclin (FAS1) repeats
MEEKKSSTGLIVGIAAAVLLVAGGFGVWALTSNDDEATPVAETSQNESSQQTEQTQATQQDLVALAIATPELSTLVTAVKAAALVETLQGDGPFTVFAPTNAAFEKLPSETLASLLDPANKEALTSVLTYHVVAGKVLSSDLTNGQVIDTIQGGELTVEITDGKVYLVDAKGGKALVVQADVEGSNGVVHVIDSVLLQ